MTNVHKKWQVNSSYISILSSIYSFSHSRHPSTHPSIQQISTEFQHGVKYWELCWMCFDCLFRFIPYWSYSHLLRWQIFMYDLIWAPLPPRFWLTLDSGGTGTKRKVRRRESQVFAPHAPPCWATVWQWFYYFIKTIAPTGLPGLTWSYSSQRVTVFALSGLRIVAAPYFC